MLLTIKTYQLCSNWQRIFCFSTIISIILLLLLNSFWYTVLNTHFQLSIGKIVNEFFIAVSFHTISTISQLKRKNKCLLRFEKVCFIQFCLVLFILNLNEIGNSEGETNGGVYCSSTMIIWFSTNKISITKLQNEKKKAKIYKRHKHRRLSTPNQRIYQPKI